MRHLGLVAIMLLWIGAGCGATTTTAASGAATGGSTVGTSGGNSGGSIASGGLTITISGLITEQGNASPSLSAKRMKLATGVAGDTVTIAIDGATAATATTDADGNYSAEVTLDEAPEGAVTVALESSSGYSNADETELTEATDVTIDADVDTTLAIASILQRLTEVGQTIASIQKVKFSEIKSYIGSDPKCFKKMEQKKYELADSFTSGTGQNLQVIRDAALAQARGRVVETNIVDMVKELMAGTIADDVKTQIFTAAAQVSGEDASFYSEKFDAAVESDKATRGIYADRFVQAASTASADLVVQPAVSAGAASVCDDDTVLEQTVKVTLSSTDATTLKENLDSDDGAAALIQTFEQYKGDSGYDFSNNFDPAVAMGFIEARKGDFTDFDPSQIKTILENKPAGLANVRTWAYNIGAAAKADPTTDLLYAAGYYAAQCTSDCSKTTDVASELTKLGDIDFSACLTDPTSTTCLNLIASRTTSSTTTGGTTTTTTTPPPPPPPPDYTTDWTGSYNLTTQSMMGCISNRWTSTKASDSTLTLSIRDTSWPSTESSESVTVTLASASAGSGTHVKSAMADTETRTYTLTRSSGSISVSVLVDWATNNAWDQSCTATFTKQ